MGLDYGERRVGVAMTDPTGAFAQPLESIQGRGSAERVLERLEELVREYQVSRIVVGLPLHMDGSRGEQAHRAQAFGERVARRLGLPVEYQDERWTSREAERALAPAGASSRRRRRRREQIDPVAAAILLRTWLARSAS